MQLDARRGSTTCLLWEPERSCTRTLPRASRYVRNIGRETAVRRDLPRDAAPGGGAVEGGAEREENATYAPPSVTLRFLPPPPYARSRPLPFVQESVSQTTASPEEFSIVIHPGPFFGLSLR
ncbi:hypothetical protein KM043_001842 [Ampulex compressa]|nr:hypothetical protein KM043_001842 [Ampulex compressa]